MTTLSITSPTDGQLKQVRRFAEDAVDRAIREGKLTRDRIQRLIEKGDEFQEDIADSIFRHTSPDQFLFEEVESRYRYSAYHEPKGIAEQIKILRQLFPGIGFPEICRSKLPSNAEGWFAIPRWQVVAETYGKAVQKVLELIKKTREGKFHNLREGQFGPKYLCVSVRSIQALEKIEEEQGGRDILVIPAQFGFRHAGRSVRRALEVMGADEFGLGAFAVGIMLLTHPERLGQECDDLWIDCAGDELSLLGNDKFFGTPCFGYENSMVHFSAGSFGDAKGHYGSASGFLI